MYNQQQFFVLQVFLIKKKIQIKSSTWFYLKNVSGIGLKIFPKFYIYFSNQWNSEEDDTVMEAIQIFEK